MTILLLLFVLPFVTSSCPMTYAVRLIAYDDKAVSNSPLWTLTGLSKSECIHHCGNETFCRSVHFNPSELTCIGFRERFQDVTVTTVSQLSNTLFQLGKPPSVPGSVCEVEVDCESLPNSQCLEGICWCDQAYDADGDTCRSLSECTSYSDNFTKYHYQVIHGQDIDSRPGLVAEACQQFCRDNPACTSCDHDYNNNNCFLQANLWAPAYAGPAAFDFYQRRCNWAGGTTLI